MKILKVRPATYKPSTEEKLRRCPQCRERYGSSSRFCTLCGTQLTLNAELDTKATVVGMCPCGARPGFRDKNGMCRVCKRRPKSILRDDHDVVEYSKFLAGATNRGFTDHRNEDAFRVRHEIINGTPVSVLVVCDGVSSSYDAHIASNTAAEEAARVLLRKTKQGIDAQTAMKLAIASAHKAVCRKASKTNISQKDPPEATIVAAIVQGKDITLGWVGDSRAYFLATGHEGEEEIVQLTKDHSVVAELVDQGKLAQENAMDDKQSHMITQCLGATDRQLRPSVKSVKLPGKGVLILCSDGMWNFIKKPSQLLGLATKALKHANPERAAATLSTELLEHALLFDGADNITVASLICQ